MPTRKSSQVLAKKSGPPKATPGKAKPAITSKAKPVKSKPATKQVARKPAETLTKKPTCKQYCNSYFLPERERVEAKHAKDHKSTYTPLAQQKDRALASRVRRAYLGLCKDIYCRKGSGCGGKDKEDFVASISDNRKAALLKLGATSGCRDIIKEFPKYYKLNV